MGGKLVTLKEQAGEAPNGTQFMITTGPAPELDATNLIVGKVSQARRLRPDSESAYQAYVSTGQEGLTVTSASPPCQKTGSMNTCAKQDATSIQHCRSAGHHSNHLCLEGIDW